MSDKPASAGRNRAGQFLPGASGNPKGRVRGSRNKLGEAFFNDLYAEWLEYGPEVITKVREEQPAVFLKVVASTLPKNLNISTNNALEELSTEEIDKMILALRDEIAAHTEAGEEAEAEAEAADKGLH